MRVSFVEALIFLTTAHGIAPGLARAHHTVPHSFDQKLSKLDVPGAQATLETALITDESLSKDFEIAWRLSRIYALHGDDLDRTGNKDGAEKAYEKAKDYADLAIKAKPDVSTGYIRRAAAAGKLALHRGPFSAVNLVTMVRQDTLKAIKLNNGLPRDQAVAHYILGRANLRLLEKSQFVRSLIGLGWANLEDALTHLKTAVESDPSFIMFRIDYARALLENQQMALAQEQLEKVSSLTIQEPGDEERKKEAAALVQSLKPSP